METSCCSSNILKALQRGNKIFYIPVRETKVTKGLNCSARDLGQVVVKNLINDKNNEALE